MKVLNLRSAQKLGFFSGRKVNNHETDDDQVA
jgi:hypothetical protein